MTGYGSASSGSQGPVLSRATSVGGRPVAGAGQVPHARYTGWGWAMHVLRGAVVCCFTHGVLKSSIFIQQPRTPWNKIKGCIYVFSPSSRAPDLSVAQRVLLEVKTWCSPFFLFRVTWTYVHACALLLSRCPPPCLELFSFRPPLLPSGRSGSSGVAHGHAVAQKRKSEAQQGKRPRR